ncbi:hypothetical protein DH2020_001024 [Rehmannia glutinosa]|uniref:AMMECR1 domain-containing protein n=1 Tax=Rehmannia glutinosa TaxID=99300 RepID=A0ABR0XYM3_REHGL
MVSANREMVVYCFDTLVAHYNSEEAPPPAFDEGQQYGVLPLSLYNFNIYIYIYVFPLFVTWKKVINDGEPRLRGCIGTLEARCIINGFRDYALTRFGWVTFSIYLHFLFRVILNHLLMPSGTAVSPIQAKELPSLECTVSILTNYETARDYLDWEVGKHGIIIEFTDPNYNATRSGTYLPEVAAHEGYNGTITAQLRKHIQLTRYQSTLFTMNYSDYVAYVKTTRGAAPTINGAKPGNY